SLALDPRDGSFWVSEEYAPSILKLSSDGVIQFRLVPEGWDIDAPGERVRPILPGNLLKRKTNRGFEGVGLSPDGSTLFAIMQSPLSDPKESAGEASRNVRVVVLDVVGEPTVKAVYVYQTDDASQVGVDDQDKIKIGDLTALSPTRFLVLERDSVENGPHKMVYEVDTASATSILGRQNLGRRTLEEVPAGELANVGVTPLAKRAVVNLKEYGYAPERIEGLAFVDERTIAVVNDNNFGFIGFEPNGRAIPSGEPTRLAVVRLPSQLP
ncbi:MAG: esterase-like activity of phytase family protein, partial [Chloroflexi bacterium]|nr:esterase-like activity of phytase family protein [Chloroflexota bacterium]